MDILKQLSEKAWVVQGRTNTGVIRLNDHHCLIIDPGQDRESAKTVMEALAELDLELAGVFITHSHADHYGGVHFLKSDLKVEYFASPFESSLMEQPLLEPIFLFGGAEPIPELTHKFILAKPVTVTRRLQEGEWEFGGVKFRVRGLPGHSTGQLGLEYENLFFAGDAFALTKFIGKYKFPFYSDVQKSFATFDSISKSNYDVYIPGHGEVLDTGSYQKEVSYNREYLFNLIALVKECLSRVPLTETELLQKMAEILETPMVTVVQFVLDRTVILAILKYLQVLDEAGSYFEDSRWLWRLR